jgi:hypothetical protein
VLINKLSDFNRSVASMEFISTLKLRLSFCYLWPGRATRVTILRLAFFRTFNYLSPRTNGVFINSNDTIYIYFLPPCVRALVVPSIPKEINNSKFFNMHNAIQRHFEEPLHRKKI